MATTHTGEVDTRLSFSATAVLDNRQAFSTVQAGQDEYPSLKVTYTAGTGNNQINRRVTKRYTIAGSANQDLDLAASLTDDFGDTITFTKIKELIVSLAAPDGTLKVRVGPQNVTNGWQGPFGGVGASDYVDVFHHQRFVDPFTGFAVTAGTGDILRIHNPGGSSVTVDVVIAGLGA